jgi:replication factor A1
MAERATELEPGTAVEIVDGYVRERDGSLELHVGDRGAVEEVEDDVAYDPDATPIAEVEIGQTVDIAGVIRSTDPKRTFDRDDGSEGQVRNVRIQDQSDDIRVALWGPKADRDLAPGDEVLAADVEIDEGWQDDLEASANWQSAVVVLEDADTDTEVTAGGDGTTPQSTSRASTAGDGGESASLGAFAEGEAPTGSETSTTESGTETDGDSRVEFTGTVVQTGEPVVLDDGTETMSVETDTHLQLGEEVTARGEKDGERLDADEIL